MDLEQVLRVVVRRIRSNLLSNEAQVKQAVLLPVLRELGWDDANPAEFVPEYSVDRGRVDYALCQTSGSPLAFIEAKQLGAADSKGEDQLFGYASNRGVPFLILTDGNVWDFYLSMAAGIPAERKFYHAELLREEKIPEYARFLEKYLQKNRVLSGKAKHEAEQRHEDNKEQERARRAIPHVWQTLLETPNELLCDLLAEEVEGECGTKPDLDDVRAFLKRAFPGAQAQIIRTDPAVKFDSMPPAGHRSKITGFVLDGKQWECRTASRTLAEVLKEFQCRDAGFMSRLAPRTIRKKRRLVAPDPNDLYDNARLKEYSLDLENGWWLGD